MDLSSLNSRHTQEISGAFVQELVETINIAKIV